MSDAAVNKKTLNGPFILLLNGIFEINEEHPEIKNTRFRNGAGSLTLNDAGKDRLDVLRRA